jgi:hypothetical protein
LVEVVIIVKTEVDAYLQAIYIDFTKRLTSSRVLPDDIQETNDLFKSKLKADEGSVYIKVVSNGAAHSFIVKNDGPKFKKGDILKAASWASPAKNYARGNIFDVDSLKNIRWAGL